jgi:hypothetical protein
MKTTLFVAVALSAVVWRSVVLVEAGVAVGNLAPVAAGMFVLGFLSGVKALLWTISPRQAQQIVHDLEAERVQEMAAKR